MGFFRPERRPGWQRAGLNRSIFGQVTVTFKVTVTWMTHLLLMFTHVCCAAA